jgi:uncharacterized tellurite resistance protein B-like protein
MLSEGVTEPLRSIGIVHLITFNKKLMEVQSQNLLTKYAEHEKAAYLGALAGLSTADREASDEEVEHLREIARAAGLSEEDEQKILEAAKDISGNDLKKSLDILKGSDLRYSLITDLIALAKADESYTEDERQNIERVAKYLNVDQNQFSVLDQFVDKAAKDERSPEEFTKPNYLQSTGMEQKFSNAGFDVASIGKSLFGFLGPVLLGGLAGRAMGGGRRGSGGLGGLGGALLGGLLQGRGNTGGMGLPGGLGSLISGLNTSRNNQSMGGLLGRLLR